MAHDVDTDPGHTAQDGALWVCNGCVWRTSNTRQAIGHVEEFAGHPAFEHIVYERIGGDPAKHALRRIAPYDGKAVVQRQGARRGRR